MGIYIYPYKQGLSSTLLSIIPKKLIIDNDNPNIIERIGVAVFFNFLDYKEPDFDESDQEWITELDWLKFTIIFLVSNKNPALKDKLENCDGGKFKYCIFSLKEASNLLSDNPESSYSLMKCLENYESILHILEYKQKLEKNIGNLNPDKDRIKIRKKLRETVEKRFSDLKEYYMFCWNEVPGKEEEKLREFLQERYGIDWIKEAKIMKVDGDKTIKLSVPNNYLSLKLNDKSTEVEFELDKNKIIRFLAKIENDKLNIYSVRVT